MTHYGVFICRVVVTDPTMAMSMVKGTLTNVLPMIVLGGWISWVFSGFIISKCFPIVNLCGLCMEIICSVWCVCARVCNFLCVCMWCVCARMCVSYICVLFTHTCMYIRTYIHVCDVYGCIQLITINTDS